MATVFAIEGARGVPCHKGKVFWTITAENAASFWEGNRSVGSKRECYVFGIKAGRGFTPGYVGKATKSLRQEVFTHHKLTHYHQFLADYCSGTPVLFFVVLARRKGAPNAGHVGQLESTSCRRS